MENKKVKPRKLTKKREGFVRDYVETGNAAEAAARNYPVKNRDVAKSVGSELLTFPDVIEAVEERKETLKEALEAVGVTPKKIATKVKVLLDAKDPKGNPDYKAIDKGVAHATKIRGDVSEPPFTPPTHATYNFLFSKETQAEVAQIEAKIKARLIKPHAIPEQN